MLCKIYCRLIEKETDDYAAVRSAFLMRHLEKCPGCRAYREQLVHLESRLRSTQQQDLDPALFDRIRTGLHQQLADEPADLPAMRQLDRDLHWRPIMIRTVAAVLILAAVAGLWQRMNRPPQDNLLSTLSSNAQRFQTQASILLQSPERSIQHEMVSLRADVEQAVTFLKNCTPHNPYQKKVGIDAHDRID